MPTLTDIEAARERVGAHTRVTPVYSSDSLSRRLGLHEVGGAGAPGRNRVAPEANDRLLRICVQI